MSGAIKRTLTIRGVTKSIPEWAEESGVPAWKVYKRSRQGVDPELCISPIRSLESLQRKPYRWRTEKQRRQWFRAARMVAEYMDRTPPRDVWDMPLEDDPWAQAAIDVACEEGHLTLDDIGKLMGVSRERVRQVAEIALRKLCRIEETAGRRNAIVDALRELDAERSCKVDPDEGGEA